MIFDLNAAFRRGKTRESFFFEFDAGVSPALPDTEILFPVKVQGEIFLTGESSAETEGEVTFTLSGVCTRCLEKTEKTFVVGFAESLGTEDGYPVINGKADLKKIVEDIIIMNTPVAFLCREDCKGLCPVCGKNLNDGSCLCNNK